MPRKRPQFAVGDRVCQRLGPSGLGETGIVIQRYELDEQYRYVVQCEDGREEDFFERELLSLPTIQ